MSSIFDAPIRNSVIALSPTTSKLNIFGSYEAPSGATPTATTGGGPALDFVPTKQMTAPVGGVPIVWIAAGAVALGAVGLVVYKLRKKGRR